MKKIIVDGLSSFGSLSGIGRYTHEISAYLDKCKIFTVDYFYGYIAHKMVRQEDQPNIAYIRKFLIKNRFFKSAARSFIHHFSKIFSPVYDLYWQPNFIPTKGIKAKKVVITVHDFSWEHYPEFHPKERIEYFKKNFYQSLKQCDHIITGSYFTKNEITERTKFPSEKISVIYHGIDHSLFYAREVKKTEQKFILAVGSIEPRKNLKNLLLAYASLPLHVKENYHLILVGATGWNNEEIIMLIQEQYPFVKYSGYVDNEKLAQLYNDATLFVYPSFYEGFGIPPLEAMACGTPVLSSDTSSLPEICGDAAYYINPLDILAISTSIDMLLCNELLREELRLKGLERVKAFSWNKSAKEHLDLFKRLSGG